MRGRRLGKKKRGEGQSGGATITGEIGSIRGDIIGGDKIVVHAHASKTIEKEVVYKLLTFLEDRRLLTEQLGYQSHFPDHLRISAQEIRRKTNEALQTLDLNSSLLPVLKKLQDSARKFQTATEGAMDGRHAHGGMSPVLPMGLSKYLKSLLDYRQEIAAAMVEAAHKHGLKVDSRIVTAASPHSEEAAWVKSVSEAR